VTGPHRGSICAGARAAPSLEQRAVGRDILKIVERHLSISQLNYVPDRASDACFDHLSSHISWFQIDEFRSPVDMAWLPGAGPKTRMLITARPSRIEISLLNQTMKFVEIDIPRAPARVGTSLDAAGVAAEVRASMSLLDLDYASVPAEQRSRDINAIVDKLLGPRRSRELESSQFHAAFTLTRPGEPLSTTGSVEECDPTCSETRPRRFGLTPETQAWLVSHCASLHFNLICMAGADPANPFTQVRIADTMPFSALINRSSFLLPAPGASMFSDPIIFSYDDPGPHHRIHIGGAALDGRSTYHNCRATRAQFCKEIAGRSYSHRNHRHLLEDRPVSRRCSGDT
jgi:hypothetical protein